MSSWRRPKVLTYHSVLPERAPERLFFYAQPTVGEFDAQIRFLVRHCVPLSLDEYLEAQNGSRRPPQRAVLVTLDDGYANSERAAEVLARHRVPSVLFVAVDYVQEHRWPWYLAMDWLIDNARNGAIDWRGEPVALRLLGERKVFRERFKTLYLQALAADRGRLLEELAAAVDARLPDRLPEEQRFLEPAELGRLARQHEYMEIGSHGLSHHDLTRLDDAALEREMSVSADRLQEWTGKRPRAVSYPDGRHDARVRAAAARHYRVGFALQQEADPRDAMAQPRLPAHAGGAETLRRVLSPLWPVRQAVWRWRARRGWI